MTPGIMGEGAQSMPDYDTATRLLLVETIFSGNASLEVRCQVPKRVHNLIRNLTQNPTPTTQDALRLYLEGTEKLKGTPKPNLKGVGELTIHQLEIYLVAVGVLQVPYSQRT